MTVSELKGILAHEFGHFSGNDTSFSNRVEPVYHGVLAAVKTMEQTQSAVEDRGLVRMIIELVQLGPQALLQAYFRGFRRVSMRISRCREFRSDAIAAEIAGKNNFLRGLDKVCVGSRLLNELWDSKKKDLAVDPGTSNYYKSFAYLVANHQDQIAACRSELLESETEVRDRVFDSHPSFIARARLVQKFSDQRGDESSALSLFDHPEEWETALTEKMRPLLLNCREGSRLLEKYRYRVQVFARSALLKNEAFIRDLAQALRTDSLTVQGLFRKNKSLLASDMSTEEVDRVLKAVKPYTQEVHVSVDVKATENALRQAETLESAKGMSVPPPQPQEIECQVCGSHHDVADRVYLKVISLLVISSRSITTPQRVCLKCGSREAWRASLSCFMWGWWSLQGFFWTIESIVINLRGGVIVGPPDLAAQFQQNEKARSRKFSLYFWIIFIALAAGFILAVVHYGQRRAATPSPGVSLPPKEVSENGPAKAVEEKPVPQEEVQNEKESATKLQDKSAWVLDEANQVERLTKRAAAYVKEKKLDEAIAVLQKALTLQPQSPSLHYYLGQIYLALNRHAEAVQELEEAVRLHIKSADAHYKLGLAYLELDKGTSALAAFKKAVELDPQDAMSYTRIGIIYKKSGMLEEARSALTEALKIKPYNLLAQDTLRQVEDELEFRKLKESNTYYHGLSGSQTILGKNSEE